MERPAFDELVAKIAEAKQNSGVDLSMEEDLSIAVMNLVSLEEHFFFTAEKTGADAYFDLMKEVRDVRKEMLAKMIDRHEGETWCVCKHLLAATMRLIEVGTKLQSDGKRTEAKEVFDRAYRVYSIFWALRLKLVDVSSLKRIPEGELNIHGKPWSVEDIVTKLVDCCEE